MKVIINQAEFAKVLSTVSRANSGKAVMPILAGIKLTAKGDVLECVATDMEMTIWARVAARVVEPGESVITGKTLTDVVRKLSGGVVELTTDDRGAGMTCGKAQFKLPVMEPKEYPELSGPASNQFTIDSEEFKTAVKQTIFATLPDDPRPFLTSVFFKISEGELKIVATDVNRLAIRNVKVKGKVDQRVLVQVKALKEMIGVIGEGEITFSVDGRQIFATADGIVISARLVEAQFPQFEQIIPKNFLGSFEIGRTEFIKILERAQLIGDSVRIEIVNDVLKVTNKDAGKGQFFEELEIHQEGDPIMIGFNARFLLDYLKVVDVEKVSFSYTGQQKPILAELPGYQYIAMPLKLEA